jgi:hypothetical protein
MNNSLIILDGPSPSGKSTFARQWVHEPTRPADRTRAHALSISEAERYLAEGFDVVLDIHETKVDAALKHFDNRSNVVIKQLRQDPKLLPGGQKDKPPLLYVDCNEVDLYRLPDEQAKAILDRAMNEGAITEQLARRISESRARWILANAGDQAQPSEWDRGLILSRAGKLISGDRQASYGDAGEGFARVGRVWGALLNIPPIPPTTVALMMAGLKSVRATDNPRHVDNWVDIAGYTGLGGEIARIDYEEEN